VRKKSQEKSKPASRTSAEYVEKHLYYWCGIECHDFGIQEFFQLIATYIIFVEVKFKKFGVEGWGYGFIIWIVLWTWEGMIKK
jgi:hypothetical protein